MQQVEEDASKECLELCNECLIKAVKKFPSQFLELCHEMDELKVNASFNDTIKAAFAQAATEKEDIKKETWSAYTISQISIGAYFWQLFVRLTVISQDLNTENPLIFFGMEVDP